MTEAEWRASTHTAPMLSFLAGQVTHRKLRLFACACCASATHLLNRYSRKALTVAERFADSEVAKEKLRLAWQDARRAAQESYRQNSPTADGQARWAVAAVCEPDINRALASVGLVARSLAFPPVDAGRLAEAHRRLVPLAYEIFGNPFRPVAVDPSWRTSTVVALAAQMYESRDFGAMPILADALQDAGCDSEPILSHCRSEGPHVRGCWVVDLLLGNE